MNQSDEFGKIHVRWGLFLSPERDAMWHLVLPSATDKAMTVCGRLLAKTPVPLADKPDLSSGRPCNRCAKLATVSYSRYVLPQQDTSPEPDSKEAM